MDEEGTLSVPSNQGVEVTLSVTKEEYTYPYDNGELMLGAAMEALNQEMTEVAGNGCYGEICTYNQTVQEN